MNRFEFYGNIEAYKRQQEELKHYGTIGQKWGIRKWQNPDGTFNEAGKERYFGNSGKKSSSSDEKIGKTYNVKSKEYNKWYAPIRDVSTATRLAIAETKAAEKMKKEVFDESKFDEGDIDIVNRNEKRINKMIKALEKGKDKKYFKLRNKFVSDEEKDICEEYINKFRSKMQKADEYVENELDDRTKLELTFYTKGTKAAMEKASQMESSEEVNNAIDSILAKDAKNSLNRFNYNAFGSKDKIGSLSKPKVKAKYLNEDGTLNDTGKGKIDSKKTQSSVASTVFKILKYWHIGSGSLGTIGTISLAALGAPAPLVVAGLAGVGITGLRAVGDHILASKLETRASNYYKMLNGGNANEN